jgi:glucose/arabinose dehydrogenase
MLIATQPGLLRVHKDGELLQTPALDLTGKVCSNSERGLLGVALDPSFSTNRYVYLYYTFNKFGECPVYDTHNPNNPANRVSRFVMSGDTIDPSSENVMIDNIPSLSRHNSGDLNFGKNGYLYVSVGDGGCDYAGDSGCQINNDASRDPPFGQDPAHNPRRRHTPDQPLPGHRQRPLQRYRSHRRRQEVPVDVRLGPSQPLPLRLRPERLGHSLLHRRRRQ